MQQQSRSQYSESVFADGLDEYATLYGGLQWDHRPAKLATMTVQELDASPPSPSIDQRSTTSKFASASYDLAAHVPQYRRHAEGLQLVDDIPLRTSSIGCSSDAILKGRFPRPPMGHAISLPNTLPTPLYSGYHAPQSSPFSTSQAPTLVSQQRSSPDTPRPLSSNEQQRCHSHHQCPTQGVAKVEFVIRCCPSTLAGSLRLFDCR